MINNIRRFASPNNEYNERGDLCINSGDDDDDDDDKLSIFECIVSYRTILLFNSGVDNCTIEGDACEGGDVGVAVAVAATSGGDVVGGGGGGVRGGDSFIS